MISNFEKSPTIKISDNPGDCHVGWDEIAHVLNDQIGSLDKEQRVILIECYHGIARKEVMSAIRQKVSHDHFFLSTDAFKGESDIWKMVHPDVTDDRVFGFMTHLTIQDYFEPVRLQALRKEVTERKGTIILFGEGASCLADDYDLVVYLDMARWEIQLRMRRNEVSNLGVQNEKAEFALQYKQAYFVDWRVLDKQKVSLMNHWDFLIDTNKTGFPKMIRGDLFRKGLESVIGRPFRVVPFFDPGPWGGQWLKKVFDLDKSEINYAWGFDCVPEENSLLFQIANETVEIPSIDLVFYLPEALLGKKVYDRFGAEFPIRFDFLDTMEGGNLSLQVHPTTEYIKEHFGMEYTQDESYYMLEAKDNACVYLGLKDDADSDEMIRQLKKAQKKGEGFVAEKYVSKWPVKKHDHVLIPAGTIHCSGKDSVVLEISATPYIFTFKLWDWGRLGLDGKPRPINIEHGEKVMQWQRRQTWTQRNLLNRVEKIAEGDGWIEEQTGLHEYQFIETRRHWFTKTVLHNTNGGVNVINLVEGREVIVESPDNSFEPYIIHYAETFIIPAAVGAYSIRPHGESLGKKCATLKAYVRTDHLVNGQSFYNKNADK